MFLKQLSRASFFTLCLFSIVAFGCKNNNSGASDNGASEQTTEKPTVAIPSFNGDLAYQFVQKQVDFGPRVPGTPAQKECADWMEEQLKMYCDTVYRQNATVTAGNGKNLPCINLIGVINPKAKNRVLLLAHWDSRPWADQDQENKDQPILGADDGGSGVAVLIALAKSIHDQPINKDQGIDILLTDVEDYGKSQWGDDSYALGTQYWANHPHIPGYKADAGILLDMVGAKGAHFSLEGYSAQHASFVQKSVWKAASDAGYSSYFVYENGGQITDDHVPVNEILKIPTIDIINLPSGSTTGFGSYWHTHQDNMSIIDPNTLKAVGQTLLQYLYTLN